MFNFGNNRRATSRGKGGFWDSAWSKAALASLASLTISTVGVIYLMRGAIETNDEMILRACLASPLFFLAGILCMGLMAKQAAKYFADGYHANNQPTAPQLPLQNTAEVIDAVARLVVQQQAQVVQVQQPQLGQGVAMLPAPTRNLMDALRDEECILIWGQKGAGKTTILLHLIADRVRRGHELRVLDPHGSPNKWGVKPIGSGRKYDVVEAELLKIEALMTERYEEIAKGTVEEGDHPYITVIIDESRNIFKRTKQASEVVSTLLTEARKTNIHIAIVNHSKSVKALGLEGEGDLREGFAVVHLLKSKHGPRRAELSLNGGDLTEVALPGPFRHGNQYHTSTIPASQKVDTKPIPTPKAADTSQYQPDTSPIPVKKELSVTEIIEKLRQKGKREEVIVKYLAKKYPKLSANAISKMSKLSRNKALAIVKAVRIGEENKQRQGHLNGHVNGRVK